MLLHVQLEDGEIEEDEYVEREAELMARLREIRAMKREQAEADVPVEANVEERRRVLVETPFDTE